MNLNFKEQMQIIAKRKNIKIADILSCDLIIELREKGGDAK